MPGSLSFFGPTTIFTSWKGSSLGNYTTQWMNEFHWSARGESAESWLDDPKSRRMKLPWPSIKIIFPSLKTVKESVLGELVTNALAIRLVDDV